MSPLLRGNAFITGAARGIGQATALAFARNGVSGLAIADLNLQGLQKTKEQIQSIDPKIQVLNITLDVRQPDQVKEAISETVKEFGRLDIAINCAGLGSSAKKTHETPDTEWMNIADVNLLGVWRCQKEELAVMVNQEDLGPRDGRGRIINISSIFGIVSTGPHFPATSYVTSKHGVVGLTRADANSYGPMNIRVNAICPGYVMTDMLKNPDCPVLSILELDLDRTPLKRVAMIEEITDAIVFLASPMSSYMQGATLLVDGGFTSQ